MKKKICDSIIILLLISIFNIKKADAISVDVNVTGGETLNSNVCSNSVCASTVGIFKKVPKQPIDGIRVILMNSSNNPVNSADLWFTKTKQDIAGGSKNIEDIFLKYNTETEYEVFKYSDFLKKIGQDKDVETITTLLEAMDSSYKIENLKNYYLVIEPIFILRYLYASTNYYYVGTPAEIVNKLIDPHFNKHDMTSGGDTTGPGGLHHQYAKYFAYKDDPSCISLSGASRGGTCNNWFVIYNYFWTFKLDDTYGSFNKKGGSYSHEWTSNYGSNIYGKGILKISDFITTGKLRINKYKKNTTTLISRSVTFKIFETAASCSTNTNSLKTWTFSSGTKTDDLDARTYYVRETSAPANYNGDSTCHTVVIKPGETTTLNVYNEPTCVSEFIDMLETTGDNRTERLAIFERYSNKGVYYYQLLNFTLSGYSTNQAFAEAACSNTKNCGLETSYTCSNISVSYRDFGGDNLSCYMPSISVDEGTYCVAEFDFNTSFLRSLESIKYKSGQLIYMLPTNLPTLNFKKRCYYLDGSFANKSFILENYMDVNKFIINGLRDGGDKLTVKEPTNSNTDSWEKTFTLTRKACISKISGKEVDMSNCDATYGAYYKGKWLYKEALVPEFTNSGNLYVYPSLEFSDGVGYKSRLEEDMDGELTITNTNKCVFEFEPELINPDLEIMFRIIDTTNPFPGSHGIGRLIGANWCDGEHLCTIGYSDYVNLKILEAPNSKGLVTIDGTTMTAEPKYKIVLNAGTINAIREYNQEHSYEETNYVCSGSNCENEFLYNHKSYFKTYKYIEQ